MKILHLLFVGITILFAACDCSYQYTVYAENQTSEPISLEYKTSVDKSGSQNFFQILTPGERIEIINTREISENVDCTGTSAHHCNLIADYVNAHIRDTIPSTLKWCDPKIQFIKSDIGQGEFVITYTPADFIL